MPPNRQRLNRKGIRSQIWSPLHNLFQEERQLPFRNNKIQLVTQNNLDKNDQNRIQDNVDLRRIGNQPENLVSAKRLTLKHLKSNLRQFKPKMLDYALIIKISANAKRLISLVTWVKSTNSFLDGKSFMRGYLKPYTVEPHSRKLGLSSIALDKEVERMVTSARSSSITYLRELSTFPSLNSLSIYFGAPNII